MAEKNPIKGADDFMSRMVADKKKAEVPVDEIKEEVPPVDSDEIKTDESKEGGNNDNTDGTTTAPPVEDDGTIVSDPNTDNDVVDVVPEIDDDGNITNWDDGVATKTPETPPEKPDNAPVDYSAMATDFGFGEDIKVTNQAELKAAIDSKVKNAEEKDFLEGVPTQLREAVELAKQGGDYAGYLSETEVDYSEFNTEDFLAMSLQKYFKNEDGSINDTTLQEYIDKMEPVDKQIQADRVKQTLEAKQKERLQAIKSRAQIRRDSEADRARQTIGGIKSISNLKLGDNHKAEILKVIESGNLNKVLFGENAKGELDYNKVADVVFNTLYGEKILSVNSQRVRNSNKREMLDSLSNKKLKGSSSRANPTTTKKSGLDSMMEQYGVPTA